LSVSKKKIKAPIRIPALRRYKTPEIFNTDQGPQYTSNAFTVALKDLLQLLATQVPNITVLFPFLDQVLAKKSQFYGSGLTHMVSEHDFIQKSPRQKISDFTLDKTHWHQIVYQYLGGLDKESNQRLVKRIRHLFQLV
jgi:hypothetical protein